jgi:site-specific DNA-methyltransferase (adenine-specific)
MREPYFQNELVTLYHGDCLEVTEWLTADVLVTDPPYGMSYKSGWTDRSEIANDSTIEVRDCALELWGTKPALVFGTWRVERPQATRNVLIWSKGEDPGMGDLSMPWGLSHEEIYVLGKGFVGQRSSSVIKANKPPVATRPDHPTPKPVGLMEQLIAKTQGVVADPFAGSGATLMAARNLGRKVIGVEMEEKYCEIIANRLSQEAFDFGGL